ncbi:rhamnan synthesis F family protein [Nocardioides sp. cx-173]|uniref:rhamnan synthesis F family protein n=1 Tax=Nocardioides sp. cx-173 TaxID=2898796 RepID=UPI001E560AE2|nr:rhamnan synthesis F family protein [Nocardioides sp. cx-173]MCD4524766.1 rhamnan synthesis F family protein [Nocardioides sp. cx-173]UGB43274.1 rhamnan synthesis F family protein [Nocardioides sp. cx-173]
MAHYDPRGLVAPHVRRHVAALASAVDELVVVSTAELDDEGAAFLESHARLIRRPNYGYDFFSYKTGLEASRLTGHDEVIVCNDTYVGPLVDYSEIFETMGSRPADFWGLTASQRVHPHVQSFFVAFRPWVLDSQAFARFWRTMSPVSDRGKVIAAYEVGLSRSLTDAGFRWSSYFSETDADRTLAQRRVAWWTVHRLPPPRSRRQLSWLLERAKDPWNPAIALADVALDGGRLPYVKIDTLRYDPYGLGADRLLLLCEQRYPEAFAGVREYLDATSAISTVRPDTVLRPTPRALRPLRRLVEYRRAS